MTAAEILPRTRAARKPFEVRRAEIVRKAASFFAQHGFDATTRDLANWLGTTQPLMYRYFPSKNALIEEIYQSIFVSAWNKEWDVLLADRSLPLRNRLVTFFEQYTDVIMNSEWMRLYLFAGLRGVEITSPYVARVEDRIIRPVLREMAAEKGQTITPDNEPRLLETVWSLQGGVFYYGVRKFVYGTKVHTDKREMIEAAVDVFLAGWPEG